MKLLMAILIIIALLSVVGFGILLLNKNLKIEKNILGNMGTVLNLIIIILTFIMICMVFKQIQLMNDQIKSSVGQTKLLESQVFVANTVSIFELADRCMWSHSQGGDYDSYLTLEKMVADPINKKILEVIENRLRHVEDRYKSIDVMKDHARNLPAIMKSDGSRTWAEINTVKVENIFDHMNRHLPSEQIKVAYFMGGLTNERIEQSSKSWGDVFDSLIKAMNNDAWCLWGRKMALISYCDLTGYVAKKVFDFDGAINDWNDPERKKEILEKVFEGRK